MNTGLPAPGCTLILAAGQGQRYRQQSAADKLLVPSHSSTAESTPILLATLRACAGLTERCVLVLADDHTARLAFARQHAPALGVELLCISSNGLGHSLAQAVAATANATGWLIALADMPYIKPATWQRLAQAIRPDVLAVPTCQGRRGHPRIIGSQYAAELRQLRGDQGAQQLFRLPAVTEIAVDDPGILIDIDLPSDRLQQ